MIRGIKLYYYCPSETVVSRDVNKDLTPKDKDKDLTPKDQDKDKDLKYVLKESLRTRTRTRTIARQIILIAHRADGMIHDRCLGKQTAQQMFLCDRRYDS